MIGCTGGMLAWLGAMVSQVLQLALMSLMLLVMPGQKTDSSALSVIPVTPWWAECSV